MGAVLTLIVGVVVLLYGIAKSTHISSVRGATISTYEEETNIDQDNALDLNARKFRVAFAFEGYLDG